MSPTTLAQVAELKLPDSEGTEHALSAFWQDNPVVFVWLRHYG